MQVDTHDTYATPTQYLETAHCRDLPELLDTSTDGGITLRFPDGDTDRVVAAVAGRQSPSSILQEKVDGCWAMITIADDRRVSSIVSRSGRHLRVGVAWLGELFAPQYRGYTLVGEIVAGTHWASENRDDDPVPLLHLYGAYDRKGRPVRADRLETIAARCGHPRVTMVRQCPPRTSWEQWTRDLFAEGVEGVVIRELDGTCYRAKPRMDADRYVRQTYEKRDRNGEFRRFADLSVCISTAGKRPQYRRVQTVLVPEGLTDADLRARVVRVVGASMDTTTGVIRHARIVDIRPDGEKAPWQCTV